MKRSLARFAGVRSTERGAVLIWAMFITILVLSSTFVVSSLARSIEVRATTARREAQAKFLSQSAAVHAKDTIFKALEANLAPAAAGTNTIDGWEQTWTVVAAGPPTVRRDESGLSRTEVVYRVEGAATVEGTRVVSREVVRSVQVPLFQFALFYQDEMHFMYPAPMFINGPVHCNSDVYLYARQGLEFDTNHFTIAGDLLGRLKFPEWSAAYPWGPAKKISIRKWVPDPYDPMETRTFEPLEAKYEFDAMGIATTGGYDSEFAGYDADGDGLLTGLTDMRPFAPGTGERYGPPPIMMGAGSGQTLRTRAHGVQRVDLPEIGDFDMYVATPSGSGGDFVLDPGTGDYIATTPGTGTHVEGEYYKKAALRIISRPNGTWYATDSAGNDVTATVAAAVTSGSMYDARQAAGSGTSLQMTTIDMAALTASGKFPANGLLYVAGKGSGTGTDVKGFQFKNGSTLPNNLNIVSPDSIYVRGDFNTVNSKSAAVMADAVNLLSKSWTGSETPGTLPGASTTKYVMSILTGDTEATAANFNGGPHNLPRFHEKWSGVEAQITGSMVCIGHSQRAVGNFKVYGDYYEAPIRRWTFDTRLNDITQLPPFTPTYFAVEELVVW